MGAAIQNPFYHHMPRRKHHKSAAPHHIHRGALWDGEISQNKDPQSGSLAQLAPAIEAHTLQNLSLSSRSEGGGVGGVDHAPIVSAHLYMHTNREHEIP